MTITHRELLDTAIAQLQTPAVFPDDQLDRRGGRLLSEIRPIAPRARRKCRFLGFAGWLF